MSDRFWKTKICTLARFINLEYVKATINDQQADRYFDAVINLIEQEPSESERAKLINDASDRAVFNCIETEDSSEKIIVKHLLSGEKLELNLNSAEVNNLKNYSRKNASQAEAREQNVSLQELFWWLWRCLPEAIASNFSEESYLIPASNNLPDASLWSDASLSAALAGTLVGYQEDESKKHQPHLVTFSFSPIQELIKASRKMRDFWAGSWLLHYLSATICWNIANKYGADSLVYPSLYQQPLIDSWLLDRYPDFSSWIDKSDNHNHCDYRSLLTAGFPNVIVVVLPKSQVKAAMQTARQHLLEEWVHISDLVFEQLRQWGWMPSLEREDPTWNGWLKAQWQTYWTALPLGKEDLELEKAITQLDENWIKAQNQACNLPLQPPTNSNERQPLFLDKEKEFINKVQEITNKDISVNVGSWWPYTFDELRFALSSVKSARTWTIPTAFTMRSTVSGVGSVVTPNSLRLKDNATIVSEAEQHESVTQLYPSGLFDGKEQLNATETVKRGLHLVLPELLHIDEQRIAASYPDLSSGVAGWLRTQSQEVWQNYNRACTDIVQSFSWTRNRQNNTKATAYMPWGIPWIDEQTLASDRRYNPRLLNAGWAIEDYPTPEHLREDKAQAKRNKQEQLEKLKTKIDSYFTPGNNPTDWYVLAVGDGDGMGEWLRGNKLENYEHYLGDSLINNPPEDLAQSLNKLKETVRKRMGPSTHNALSRALLDFSNRLVPYLTEERYAGRLIYSGGDDVFAYTNLWEWDKWLWDVQQCFRGSDDPHREFNNRGDYWQWKGETKSDSIPDRPLFTMGSKATISFGLVIAHHSVPLAIALESLWQAEEEAKEHLAVIDLEPKQKDAVQVRVLFGNGNTLSATSKFEVFHYWQELLETVQTLPTSDRNSLSALLEQAAQTWKEHPAPLNKDAIEAWTRAFCQRREILNNQVFLDRDFPTKLQKYLSKIIAQTQPQDCDSEIQNWLKLAAFVLRNREINLVGNRE